MESWKMNFFCRALRKNCLRVPIHMELFTSVSNRHPNHPQVFRVIFQRLQLFRFLINMAAKKLLTTRLMSSLVSINRSVHKTTCALVLASCKRHICAQSTITCLRPSLIPKVSFSLSCSILPFAFWWWWSWWSYLWVLGSEDSWAVVKTVTICRLFQGECVDCEGMD